MKPDLNAQILGSSEQPTLLDFDAQLALIDRHLAAAAAACTCGADCNCKICDGDSEARAATCQQCAAKFDSLHYSVAPSSYKHLRPFKVGCKSFLSWIAAVTTARENNLPVIDSAGVCIWAPKGQRA